MKIHNVSALWLSILASNMVLAEPQINAAACSLVNSILQKAQAPTLTSFCSRYLNIATKTITSTATPKATTVTTTSTATTTVTSFSSTSTSVSTVTQTATASTVSTITITATEPNTRLASTTITSTAATVYYHLDGAPVARREAAPIPVLEAGLLNEISERDLTDALNPRQGIVIPSALALLGRSVVSSVCSCLRIPTATATSVVPASTPTITSTVKTTSTVTSLSATTTTSLTTTTSTITVSAYTTLTSLVTASPSSTTTITSTITRSIPAACTSEPPDPYFFPQVTRQTRIVYEFSSGTRLDCCAICYQTPNCFSYFYYIQGGSCNAILATDQLTTGVSNYCPLGISPNSQLSTDTNSPGFGGYLSGPCNIGAPL